MLKSTAKGIATFMLISVLISNVAIAGGEPQGKEHRVSIMNWMFNPTELTIQAGDTVTWVNDDDTAHDVAFYDVIPANAPTEDNQERLRVKQSYSLTFDKPGIYKYLCTIHADYDMKGVIIVK